MKNLIKPIVLFLTGSILIFWSCTKEYLDLSNISDEVQIENWEGVIPLAYANFTISDILKDADKEGVLRSYEDNLLYLVFEEYTVSQKAATLIEIDDQLYNQTIEGSAFLPGMDRVEKTFNFNIMAFDRPRAFEEVTLKSGNLYMRIQSGYNKTGMIILKFQVKKPDGTQLIDTFMIDDGSGNYDVEKNINLAGHTILTGNSVALDTTYFKFIAEAFIDDATTPPSGELSMDIGISNLDYSYVRGYFGQDTISYNETEEIKIDIMSDEASGDFRFLNPQLKVYVSNSFGIPISFEADSLFAHLLKPDTPGDSTQQLLFNPGNSSTEVDVPYNTYENAGEAKDTTYNFSDDVIGFSDMIRSNPDKLWYNLTTFTNKETTIPELNQYITDTSNLKMKVSIELPIDGFAENYLIHDTLEANLEEIFTFYTFVEKLKIQLTINNGLPIDIKLQGTWLDSNYVVIDSLYADGISILAKSAKTSADPIDPDAYRAKSATQTITNFTYTGADVKKLSKARHIVLNTIGTTWHGSDQERVKIYATDMFYVKVGVDLKAGGNSRDIEKISK